MQKQSKNWPGVQYPLKMAKSIVFGTKIILQVSSINIYDWSCNANVGSNVIYIKKGKVNFWTPYMCKKIIKNNIKLQLIISIHHFMIKLK